jgi:hypothetical protein
MAKPLRKTEKKKIELAYDPAIPLLGRTESRISKR